MKHDISKTTLMEQLLRRAARERRRVRVIYRHFGERGVTEHERQWEPYAIRDGIVHVFSHFRDEFRRVPLAHIVNVEILRRSFEPRRPIET